MSATRFGSARIFRRLFRLRAFRTVLNAPLLNVPYNVACDPIVMSRGLIWRVTPAVVTPVT